jgi:hypothetical protein
MALQGLNPEAAWVPEPIPNHPDPETKERRSNKVNDQQILTKDQQIVKPSREGHGLFGSVGSGKCASACC